MTEENQPIFIGIGNDLYNVAHIVAIKTAFHGACEVQMVNGDCFGITDQEFSALQLILRPRGWIKDIRNA